jgi:hypothetical protein
MYNLLVKYSPWAEGHDTIQRSRVFEYTEKYLMERFEPGDQQLDFASLVNFPTLFVQESTGAGDQVARVGTITRARTSGQDVTLDYAFDLGVPSLLNNAVRGFASELDIQEFEFTRTHWAVKDVDLFRTLLRVSQPRRQRPNVFQISENENIEPSLVSAMMPFHPDFNAVYAALHRAAEVANLRCRRADDIWENPAVIQDVVSLIDRSRVVIADCTGRNPNVFYEIGIAHTLGREVILITQNADDIPFDLRHLRYVSYLNNNEGLDALVARLQPRLIELGR